MHAWGNHASFRSTDYESHFTGLPKFAWGNLREGAWATLGTLAFSGGSGGGRWIHLLCDRCPAA